MHNRAYTYCLGGRSSVVLGTSEFRGRVQDPGTRSSVPYHRRHFQVVAPRGRDQTGHLSRSRGVGVGNWLRRRSSPRRTTLTAPASSRNSLIGPSCVTSRTLLVRHGASGWSVNFMRPN